MTSWFSSPLKWLPQPLTAVTLGIILNLFFQRYPELKNRLAELSGKIFQFDVEDLEQSFFMVVDEGGDVRIHTYSDTVSHVTMAGSLEAFLALLFNTRDPDSLFFARALKLSGETDTGLHFKNILDNVEIDWEKELTPWMGSMGAKAAMRALSQLQQLKEQGWDRSEVELDGWLKRQGIPRRAQWEMLQAEANELVGRVERLERSFSRVERKRALAQATAAPASIEQPVAAASAVPADIQS
ncbi:MAG: SCP2 sterol-binding domain-containing protein [Magnetococcales bacterium]|nr:SCP2 sterol-binding domain-containing protein [Magnetococcales bacterium]